MRIPIKAIAWAGMCVLGLAFSAGCAAQAIVNGSFEQNGGAGTSTFTGWTVVDQPNSAGSWFAQTGTTTPLTSALVPSPPAGKFAAMTDQTFPMSSVLYQDVAIPAGGATLSFDMFYKSAVPLSDPGTLDNINLGSGIQGFRIDLMNPSAATFDTGSGVVANIYITKAGDPVTNSGYRRIFYQVGSQFGGQTLRIRFAEIDDDSFLNLGIDNVTLGPPAIAAPALGLWALWAMIAAFIGAGWFATRRRFF